jgi:hypothetical protein
MTIFASISFLNHSDALTVGWLSGGTRLADTRFKRQWSVFPLLGIPDDNSSFMKGPAEAPTFIRRILHSDAYAEWSETGVELSVAGRFVNHGNIQLDGACDPWELIEQSVGRAMGQVIR